MIALFFEIFNENQANNHHYPQNYSTNYRNHKKASKKTILSLFEFIILIAFLGSFLKCVLVIL